MNRRQITCKIYCLMLLGAISCLGYSDGAWEADAGDSPPSGPVPKAGFRYPPPKADPLDALTADERNRILEDEVKRRTEMQRQADQPIAFYGKIIDQHGEPVPGVDVKTSIGAFGSVFRYGVPIVKNIRVVADQQGRFSITGEKGISFGVDEMSKPGYAFQRIIGIDYQSRPGEFADSSKPYMIVAYKIDEPPPKLVIGKMVSGFDANGRWYYLDLINKVGHSGQLGGDVQLRFKRADDATRGGSYDWDVTLKVSEGGGLIEAGDILRYEAPQDGYQPEWHLAYKKDDPAWQGSVDKKFYLQSRHGTTYARCELTIDPFYNEEGKAVIEIRYWLNPNSSRNLFSTEENW